MIKSLKEWKTEDYILKIPIVFSSVLVIFTIIFFKDIGMTVVAFIFGLIVSVIPYFIYKYHRIREVAAMEDQLPNFLRDLVEEKKSGMTLTGSIKMCSRRDYGKLSKEIKKMHHQLTWSIPFEKVLRMFGQRVKESPLIKRSLEILIEAYRSGGNIVSTMESVASDASMIKEAEKERKSTMAQHIVAMYLIYFMFIAIVIALTKILLSFSKGIGLMGGLGFGIEPCSGVETGLVGGICSIFFALCKVLNLETGLGCYYKSVFTYMIIVQGLFSGLVAGQIGENSAFAGIKHSLIMLGVGFTTYLLFLITGFI